MTGSLVTSQTGNPAQAVKVNKIWSNQNYNSFTSLISFKGRFYCAFREGENHVYGKDGVVRIISSKDGEHWKSVALLTKQGYDLRDPKLSVTPDGRIMVLIGGSVYQGKNLEGRHSQVSFSDRSGKNFSDPQPVAIQKDVQSNTDWLWRVTWYQKVGYGVVYQLGDEWTVVLLKTTDGIHYEFVTKLNVTGKPNESTVRIMPDGEMLMMVRRENDNQEGYWGRSKPPYKEWQWSSLGFRLGGPDFIAINDSLLVAGTRVYAPEKYTALFTGNRNGKFKERIRLPSGGDSSYPGFVLRGDMLFVSYYSSHEGEASIYFAQVPLELLK